MRRFFFLLICLICVAFGHPTTTNFKINEEFESVSTKNQKSSDFHLKSNNGDGSRLDFNSKSNHKDINDIPKDKSNVGNKFYNPLYENLQRLKRESQSQVSSFFDIQSNTGAGGMLGIPLLSNDGIGRPLSDPHSISASFTDAEIGNNELQLAMSRLDDSKNFNGELTLSQKLLRDQLLDNISEEGTILNQLGNIFSNNQIKTPTTLGQLGVPISDDDADLLSDSNIINNLLSNPLVSEALGLSKLSSNSGKSLSSALNNNQMNRAQSAQFGVPLPKFGQTKNQGANLNLQNLSNDKLVDIMNRLLTRSVPPHSSNSVPVQLPRPVQVTFDDDEHRFGSTNANWLPSNLGIPLPAIITNSASGNFGSAIHTRENNALAHNNQIGIPLPSINSNPIQSNTGHGGFGSSTNFGIPLSNSIFSGSTPSGNNQANLLGIPLPESYSVGPPNSLTQLPFDQVGVPLPIIPNTGDILPSRNNIPPELLGVPLPTLNGMTLGELMHTLSKQNNISPVLTPNNNVIVSSGNLGSQTSGLRIEVETESDDNLLSQSKSVVPGSTGQFGVPLPTTLNQNIAQSINNIQSGPTGISLPSLQDMTLGELLQRMNGQSGIKVLPMPKQKDLQGYSQSSFPNVKIEIERNSQELGPVVVPSVSATPNSTPQFGIPLPDLHSSNAPSIIESNVVPTPSGGLRIELDDTSSKEITVVIPPTTSSASPTRRRRPSRRRTTQKPPDVLRKSLSDLWFSKGQWFGTLLGGFIDVGSAIMDGLKNHSSRSTYGRESYSSYS